MTIQDVNNHSGFVYPRTATEPAEQNLSETERRRLRSWNRTGRSFPSDRCIHELFEDRAAKSPEAVAVSFRGQRLTYGELNEISGRFAQHLKHLGVGPESLVGLCVERSLDMVIGLMGVLKAGGAYVPIEPTCPDDRLAMILKEASLRVVVTQRHLAGRFANKAQTLVMIDADWPGVADGRVAEKATPEHPAYVIFTSGSTGKPKGVVIPHRALVNHSTAMRRFYGLRPGDRVLQFAALSFDVSAEEIYPTWFGGGTLILWPETSRAAPLATFLRFVEQQRITVLNLPTPYWEEWVSELDRVGVPPSVRLTVVGSDRVVPEKFSAWRRRVGKRVRCCNAYGPTEATITATVYDPDAEGESEKSGCVPIGRPIANVRTYVLSEDLKLVPVGVPGELYIGGVGLARGYLNQPVLTAEKFIPDPFSRKAGARLYKTGDQVRYLPDGNLEFLGRFDDQVKIRGYRVELGEIETVLRKHPEIERAVVMARTDGTNEKKLAAYVVPKNNHGPSPEELRSFVQDRLPDYMLPAAYVVMEQLPIGVGGKIDRRRLPAPDRFASAPAVVPPRDELERQLVEMWEKILAVRPVGIRDNFFDLGGHSLMIVRLIGQIEKNLNVNLPVSSLVQAPTVEQLAQVVRLRRGSSKSLLLASQTNGHKPPLFSYGGAVQLGRYLGADQPYYLLESHGLDGRCAPATVEEMAEQCISEIREIQPHGPYYLVGYSFGGLVIFEIAQRLKQRGEQIALLALVDPCLPNLTVAGSDDCAEPPPPPGLLPEFFYHCRNIAGLKFRDKWEYVMSRAAARLRMLKKGTRRMACETFFRFGYRLPPFLRMFYFMEITAEAIQRYDPKVFANPFIVFRRPDNGTGEEWRQLGGDAVRLEEVTAEHLEIMKEPYLPVLADKLRKYLEEAQGGMYARSAALIFSSAFVADVLI